MKTVDLFAGAGGASLGLRDAGCEHLACIERDKDAAETLAEAGFPAICGDVRNLALLDGMQPDLVWASFPCQCWSHAGKRLGARDERNGWPWTLDAIDAMGPRWFIAENVPGLTQHRSGCRGACLGPELCPAAYLDRVILEQLRDRYDVVSARVLNASGFGVPQHRRRLIIVAGNRPIAWPAATHGKPTGQADLFGHNLLPWVSVAEAIGLCGELSGMRNTDNNPTQERPAPTSEPAPTVGGRGNQIYRVGGAGRNPQNASVAHLRSYRDITEEPSTTICAATHRVTNAGPWVVGGDRDERRRLTTDECAKLQGFPDGHPFRGSATSRYQQIGNAVPPRLAEVVARAVMESDEKLKRSSP